MLANDFLKGTHVALVPLGNEDLPVLTKWHQDVDFLRALDAVPAFPRSERQIADWLEQSNRSNTTYTFGIRANETNELVGYVELDGIMWSNRVSGVSIAIAHNQNRRKGYGAEALNLVLRFAFHELNLHRVQLTVFGYNTSAIALYEKVGFQKEGAYREFIDRDGKNMICIFTVCCDTSGLTFM
ncbi:GNAT family N-acetyltransferase [Paenibacillus montanisoli]|uniref:GNAT family N-acetyltransferase n=1 Tax=Paenibacillus montanisoli TaxID=2081970 RepID=UPI001F0CD53A|nr:GNAT family protein [Paenibacillus montanisoli]